MYLSSRSRAQKGISVIFFISCLSGFASSETLVKTLVLHLLDRVTHYNTTWEAIEHHLSEIPQRVIGRLVGTLMDYDIQRFPNKTYPPEVISELPQSFNSIDKWPLCTSINEIRDQGGCGSCWAVSVTSVITDRVCIYSNGTINPRFSGNDLLSCCILCGKGCDGGYANIAWERWKLFGIVTGGQYLSDQGCLPYVFKPCTMIKDMKLCDPVQTPICNKTCIGSYNKSYKEDKYYGKHIYTLKGEDNIRAEIFHNGPVQTIMTVYADLVVYKRGIYQHVEGANLGGHAVKIVGWGEEDGVKYWVISNTWGPDWGENGFFRIIRGTEHCWIEKYTFAGEPSL